MKNIYYLSSCNTCQRIISEINVEGFELQDIKQENISAEVLDFVAKKSGGYENIFSKRAIKYRSMGLHEMDLNEEDYRKYMLEEYTFLKRPFIINGDKVYVGNSKKIVDQLKDDLS